MVKKREGCVMRATRPATLETCEPRRLLAYSHIDPTFGNADGPYLIGTSAARVVARPDGRTLFASVRQGAFYVGRLMPDGTSIDGDFGAGGVIGLTAPNSGQTPLLSDLVVLPNGDMRIAASAGSVRVYAITVDGELDLSFGVGGFRDVAAVGAVLEAPGLAVDGHGNLYLAGSAELAANTYDSMIARLTADGTIDQTFGGGVRIINRSTDLFGNAYDAFGDVVILDDFTPVAFGIINRSNGIAKLARFSPTGVLDPAWPASPTLGPVGSVNYIGDMALDAQQRIYVAIERNSSGGTTLVRLNSSTGSLDTSYGGQGYSASPAFDSGEYFTRQFALAPDGSAFTLANAFATRMGVVTALNPDGGRVLSFGINGFYRYTPAEFGAGTGAIRSVWIQDANHILVSGAAEGGDKVFVDRLLLADADGVYTTATGFVFSDDNGNGLRDAGEKNLAATIFDDDNGNGLLDPNERLAGSNPVTGAFSLTHLSHGPHRITVAFDPTMQQMTVAPAGGYTFTTTAGGVVGPFEFGIFSISGIRGYVWEDANLSQTPGPGEPLIAGRTMFLDLDEDGMLDPSEPTSVTDAAGEFNFPGLQPGIYTLGHILPEGWLEYTRSLTPRRYEVRTGFYVIDAIGTYRPALAKPRITFSGFNFDNNLGTFFDLFFSETVDASLAVGDLVVTNTTTGVPLQAQYKRLELIPAPGKTYARLWFEPLIPNGRYRLDLAANAVVDAQGEPLTAAYTNSFSYLHGDVTQDGVINFNDLLSMAQRYGSSGRTYLQGNLDRDPLGKIDFGDLLVLAQNYGNALSTAAVTTSRRRAGNASDILA